MHIFASACVCASNFCFCLVCLHQKTTLFLLAYLLHSLHFLAYFHYYIFDVPICSFGPPSVISMVLWHYGSPSVRCCVGCVGSIPHTFFFLCCEAADFLVKSCAFILFLPPPPYVVPWLTASTEMRLPFTLATAGCSLTTTTMSRHMADATLLPGSSVPSVSWGSPNVSVWFGSKGLSRFGGFAPHIDLHPPKMVE